jgi:hypothetical protein
MSVVPVATTEQRIRFKEVQLTPKSPESVPLDRFIHENPTPPVEIVNRNRNIVVDRITGKFVPEPTRAAKGKGKKKGKEKAMTTQTEPEGEKEDQGVGEVDVTMADQGESAAQSNHEEAMDVGDG